MSDASQGPGWWLASDGKWYPPEAASPPQQPAPPQPQQPAPTPVQQPAAAGPPQAAPASGYGAPPPGYAAPVPGYTPPGPPQSGMSGCLKAFLIVLAVLFVGGIIVAAILVFAVGSVVHHASNELEADSKTAAATCRGVSYPDRQSLDHCANGSGEVRDTGLTVTARNLRRVSVTATTTFGPTSTPASSSELCADVTFHNRSSDTKAYTQVLWELRPPGGGSQGANLGGSGTLGSGTLTPGSDARGTVCFSDPGVSGQYVLIWHPLAISVDRGIWLFNVS